METTKVSSKGQVIIPKPIRAAHGWETGQDLVVIDVGDGVLLKPKTPFAERTIHEVASCLHYAGKQKNLREMEDAIQKGVRKRFRGRS